MRKIFYSALIAAGLLTFTSCESWLDVNTNPNGPDRLEQPDLFLPQVQAALGVGIQWDGRFTGFYTQMWTFTGVDYALDLHANPLSDTYATLWRNVYWNMGVGLSDMIENAERNKKYDFAGVGYIMRAWGWQLLTDYHSDIIVSQAFEPGRNSFDYDSQEFVYEEIQRLLKLGIQNLERTDGLSPDDSGLAAADYIYQGDRGRWIKLAYGLLARNAHRLTNKSSYDPNEVIGYVDKSLASNADDAFIRFEGTVSANTSFFGPLRNNIGSYRQTDFIVRLLGGNEEVLNPALSDPNATDPYYEGEHLRDPRLTAMLAPSPADSLYRGLTPAQGIGEWTAGSGQRPNTFWNTTSGNAVDPSAGQIYFFGNAEPFPLMTYAELQFVKAEAEWIKAGKAPSAQALEAYKNGVTAHMGYARQFAADKALYDERMAAYLESDVLVPDAASGLTLSKIMLQKYIATWGWGFFETWSDMRRYHYTEGGAYAGFELPQELAAANEGVPAYRGRPRFNSEYMWNKAALDAIGGNDPNYHTYEMWFSKPE
ncbi:SusD/RagB family nutrient-binding outer membrane lipoprotein [Pontibacter harenae]|uniref:SusD/RagB family nutrient-binding outer membrane lipoprotein n=1 Tax=Pontibacter harenae TaxID=2894083 RepID=UPI001E4E428A|nr:SusD/RagB family nutrient-binding outer membrane lipoprotein [Pontibacter harenae]MCC9167832.1 SusD/RagB family nutrient-binding outer membrane lipoprotein [Pontibacter harenae]